MARPASNSPTKGELELLKVLWQRGGSTVREVLEDLPPQHKASYNALLTRMQILVNKGYARRDASRPVHVYSAALSKTSHQRSLVKDLVSRVFGGSAKGLIMHALSSTKATPEQIDQLRKQLDKFDEN